MIGRTLGDRYLLEAVLGDGGTAVVYRALDLQLDLPCAVKVLRGLPGRTEQLRARLRTEAQTMARLSHPNVLRVFGAGSEGEVDWIAMELSADGSVADRVRADGPFAPRRALQVALQVLAALEAAHAAGVVHRDVKPDNLLLHGDGTVMLCDFGIALLDDTTRLTQSGFAMGSLPYMAPEQRVDAHQVGPAVDLYATAATLFHLLTGATPVDLFLAPPSSPRFAGLPEGLVELIRKGTHADPAQRFPSAGAMAEALRAALPLAGDRPLPATGGSAYSGAMPETSRVPTTVESPVDAGLLEAQLQRDWLVRDGEERRARARRQARLWLGIGAVVAAVLFGLGGRLAIDRWLDWEAAHQRALATPIAGVWKGTFGAVQATLELRGAPTQLSGVLVLHGPDGEQRIPVEGGVRAGEVVLGAVGQGRTYRARVAIDGRLDGEGAHAGGVAPFHLVRVGEPPPLVHSPDGRGR